MRSALRLLIVLGLVGTQLWGSPLSTTAKNSIPNDIQQLIVVDYRSLNSSPTALALRDKVMPPQLKELEAALRASGIDPDKDVDQLVFATYRVKDGLRVVGLAQGNFPNQKVLPKLRAQKIKGTKYRLSTIYPMSGGVQMSLVDPTTMVFGAGEAVKAALDARDGESRSLNYNTSMLDMTSSVQDETIWSILDQAGTQYMMKSALGDASNLADYDVVKNRLKGSRYKMTFTKGVNFDMDVLTSDAVTATTLSGILKAGVMFRKATASDTEKIALDSVEVKSDSKTLQLQFKTDDTKFQALLNSDLFATLSK